MIRTFISNSNCDQPMDLRLAAGYGLLLACKLASSNAQAAEYQHGTHAATVMEAQSRGTSVWHPPAASAKQGPVPIDQIYAFPQDTPFQIQGFGGLFSIQPKAITAQPIARFVAGAPQTEDRPTSIIWPSTRAGTLRREWPMLSGAPQLDTFQPSAVFFSSLLLPPPIAIAAAQYTFGTHAEVIANSQFKGAIFGAQVRPPPILGRVFKPIIAAPQQIDLTLQGFIETPSFNPQGSLNAYVWGEDQENPNRDQGSFTFKSVFTALTPQPVAPIISGSPQIEDRPSWIEWKSTRAGLPLPHVQPLWAEPQRIDLTQQGWVQGPLPKPPARSIGQIFVPPQPDLNVNYSLLERPALAPLIPIPPVIGLRQSVAEAILTGSLFTIGIESTVTNPVPAGIVIDQFPEAPGFAPIGSAFNLVISLGPPAPAVPDESVVFDLYEMVPGTVVLVYKTPNTPADSFQLMQNGLVFANSNGFTTTVSGLLVDTDYLFEVLAVYGSTIVQSRQIPYRYGSNEFMTVTPISRGILNG